MSRGSRPRRTRDEMLANGCSPEGADLVEALDELMSARYASRHEFVEAAAGLAADGTTVSEKMLSEQMGSTNPRFSRGPSWKVARLIVDTCSRDGRWIPELARIAGLWARAHDTARPPGYYGSVFPAAAAETPWRHLNALVDDFPQASSPPRRCPYRPQAGARLQARLASLLAVLALAAVPWVVSVLAAGLHLAVPERHPAWLLMASCLIVLGYGLFAPWRWYVPARLDGARLASSPPKVPASNGIAEWRHDAEEGTLTFKWVDPRVTCPVPANARSARQRRRLRDTLTWSLEPRATIVTPLTITMPWSRWLSGTTACVNGHLGIVFPKAQGEQPLVEWTLVDDDGRMHAAGLLPPATGPGGRVATVTVPEFGEMWGAGLPVPSPPPRWWNGHSEADPRVEIPLDGTLFWPWRWSQVNVMLRRLDTLPDTVQVTWREAGLHYHRTTREAPIEVPLLTADAAGQAGNHVPVQLGSQVVVTTPSAPEWMPRASADSEDSRVTIERTAEPYEARGKTILLWLDAPIDLRCPRCGTGQATRWCAAYGDTLWCKDCFLACHPVTGEPLPPGSAEP